ncbi:MAG: helix-turn-helix domain containing protein [Desulfovibrio sp.]|jgi:hypothetical protein|nr:helix-turn-helix domain containing protein [Desulfovibrio sp.]
MTNSYPFPPEIPNDEAEARLARVYHSVGCRTQNELADFFDIRQSSISDAKKRGSIPAEWLVQLVLKKMIHPHWILTGEGPHMLQPIDLAGAAIPPEPVQAEPVQVTKIKPPQDCALEELVAEIVRRVLKTMG